MCRLMGYVSHDKKSFPQMAGAGFADFVALSSIHCDGWGVSTINHDEASAHLVRAAEMAHSSPQFDAAIQSAFSDGGLLHLRWATAGLPVSENNAHPFVYEDFTFIHNGSITPPASVEPFISPELMIEMSGETDSERYFFALISQIKESGFIAGVLKGVAQIISSCSYSSINAMVMNEDTYIAICEHDPAKRPAFGDDSYYELKYRSDENGVVVASSGWPQDGWVVLPNHHALVVDRKTFASKIVPL